MPDWYRDHNLSPECYPDEVYLDWAQDNGLYVDAAGNVDYGPPASLGAEIADEDAVFADDDEPSGLDTWEF
jgi:hypothetical protein